MGRILQGVLARRARLAEPRERSCPLYLPRPMGSSASESSAREGPFGDSSALNNLFTYQQIKKDMSR